MIKEARGYFGVGMEGISKDANFGTIARTAHAFGASFIFAIKPDINVRDMRSSDTAGSPLHVPYYQYDDVAAMHLPKGCQIVGVELVEGAVPLPSFRHPSRAAYIFGSEMGNLSDDILDRCDHVLKIPMKFCVNIGVAAAIVMYDRQICLGHHAPRPVKAGGPPDLYVDVEKMKAVKHPLRRRIRNPKNVD